MLVRVLLAAAMLAVVWTWWTGTPPLLGRGPGPTLKSAGELTGMLGGLLVCVQILLVARTPWLEQAIGRHRLVVWHRTLGPTVLVLVTLHVLLAVLAGQVIDRVPLWQEVWHGTLVQPQVLRAVIGTALLVLAGVSSIRAIRRRISYEAWYWVHTSTYVATYLTFGHQIRAGSHFVGSPAHRLAWVALYLATAAVVLVWRVVLPGVMVVRHRVRVADIVPEVAGVTSVWLHGPHVDELDVRAGQYFRFRFLSRGHLATAHPYSVSALPADGRMRITVGALGDHSSSVSALAPGTLVLMHGPYGRFTADRAGGRKVLLIAGGVGISPILPLAQDLSRQGRDVVVIHRGSDADQLPLSEELAEEPRLRLIRVLGRRSDLGYDPMSARDLSRLVPDLRHREVFLCASAGLSRTLITVLDSLGVHRRHIHLEQLSLS